MDRKRAPRQGAAVSLLAAILAQGCPGSDGLTAKQAIPPTPIIPYVPGNAVSWPVWPTETGFLVGGSGARIGGPAWPVGVSPGLGLGALLIPSRLIGTWLGFPGFLPGPLPFQPAFPVWVPKEAGETPATASPPPASPKPPPKPKPGDVIEWTWTKYGMTPLPLPIVQDWPADPWLMSPWGPVALLPKPPVADVPLYPLGFPPADGTPVSKAEFFVAVQRTGNASKVMLFDFATRTLHPPPSLDNMTNVTSALGGGGIILVARAQPQSPLVLVDLLTGGLDPLPELADTTPGANGNFDQRAAHIVYTTGAPGAREVGIFDRRLRMRDPLQHLNAGNLDVFSPNVDAQSRFIAVTRRAPGGDADLAIYDTITGLVDPLPAVNTPANEQGPFFDWSARWVAYFTDADGTSHARIYDRFTGAIDTLPELDHLGPVLKVRLSRDGHMLACVVQQDGRRKVFFYFRGTGIIDPVPELNQTADETFF